MTKKNNNVVKFPEKNIKNRFTEINNIKVIVPKNKEEFLAMCKEHLDPDDYEELLCSILDYAYYVLAERQIKDIVDSYHSY